MVGHLREHCEKDLGSYSASDHALIRAGIIKEFEIAFELAWKTLKDYLSEFGIDAKSPRVAIEKAWSEDLISEVDQWMRLLKRRNELVHVYDEEHAAVSVGVIRTICLPLFASLVAELGKRADP